MRNPFDLLQCLGAVFDPNASQQLLNECSLRGGIFQSYWAVWVVMASAAVVGIGFVLRRYRRSSAGDDDLERNRPPTMDLDATKQGADEALERRQELDQLLEEADAISELLRRDQLDGSRLDRWTSDAEHFVALDFHAYATDFRIAREPKHVQLSGAHTDRIWLPLKRLVAQMEVLQEIKRELRQMSERDT